MFFNQLQIWPVCTPLRESGIDFSFNKSSDETKEIVPLVLLVVASKFPAVQNKPGLFLMLFLFHLLKSVEFVFQITR